MKIKTLLKLSRENLLILILLLLISGCASTLPTRTFEERTIGLYVQGTELYKKGETTGSNKANRAMVIS